MKGSSLRRPESDVVKGVPIDSKKPKVEGPPKKVKSTSAGIGHFRLRFDRFGKTGIEDA